MFPLLTVESKKGGITTLIFVHHIVTVEKLNIMNKPERISIVTTEGQSFTIDMTYSVFQKLIDSHNSYIKEHIEKNEYRNQEFLKEMLEKITASLDTGKQTEATNFSKPRLTKRDLGLPE